MSAAALLACDWGSTNLRAWVMAADGQVLDAREFKLGVNGLAPGEAGRRFVDEVRPALGAEVLPALLCGAVGSNIGWRMAPYADCPARIEDVAGGRIQPMENVWITPGLRCAAFDGACDVLRGEETQAFGWLGDDPARARGRKLICQPGTHAKWLVVEDGVVTRFLSAFTGELFAVLSAHSILRNAGAGEDLATFDEGCAAAGEGDALLNRIYTARSRVAGRGADNATTGAYLSGLLIGAEVAATPRLLGLEDAPVILLGDKSLCDRYARALGARSVETDIADGDVAVRAGLVTIARLAGLL
jgi:2-dehydro-3-deoxygalactonokinase